VKTLSISLLELIFEFQASAEFFVYFTAYKLFSVLKLLSDRVTCLRNSKQWGSYESRRLQNLILDQGHSFEGF